MLGFLFWEMAPTLGPHYCWMGMLNLIYQPKRVNKKIKKKKKINLVKVYRLLEFFYFSDLWLVRIPIKYITMNGERHVYVLHPR